MTNIKVPKKLIEVALPLDAINLAAGREKSIRHGHPSTLHMWWARRPLAAARAVIFAQMVNDPGYERQLGRGVNKAKADLERDRLFKLIEELVQWKNTNNEDLLRKVREEILRSWRETCELNKNHPEAGRLFNPENLPAFHDPFAGGGTIPLEAQRLGLDSYASDLNPVAVTLNKAMIEIPPIFSGRRPVGPALPEERQKKILENWTGSRGLATDIRRYGDWMRKQALEKIGSAYPLIKIDESQILNRPELKGMAGKSLPVVAWLWVRTVKSPNPAFSHVHIPLASSFLISDEGDASSYVEPQVSGDSYTFRVKHGPAPKEARAGTKTNGSRSAFYCLLSKTPVSFEYIRAEAQAGRLGTRLLAIVAEGPTSRLYLDPSSEHEKIAKEVVPEWRLDTALPEKALSFRVQLYGMKTHGDLFTNRQLLALTTFSDVVESVVQKCEEDAVKAGMEIDPKGIEQGGTGSRAYAEAIGLYLAFAANKCADYWCTIATWMPRGTVGHAFSKQALPMTWDFPEANPFADFHCAWHEAVEWVAKSTESFPSNGFGCSKQIDAAVQNLSKDKVISTDPPYYDNIGYADLSDFFYGWLRKSLRPIFPGLYATMAVPKAEELVATPFRHGGSEAAEEFFLSGMKRALTCLAEQAHPAFPITVYYAFKQSETKDAVGTSSTGWETFLQAVVDSGLAITGTWPMRTERTARSVGQGTNSLASSIILVCRRRASDAPTASRRDFIRQLNSVLPDALDEMTRGGINSPVAPVDLSQAIIGPGMAIFSEYAAVLEADGSKMNVRSALQLINRFLAEDDFDHDTQFCLHWFEQHGWGTGRYGEAELLSKSKGTSVEGLKASGVVASGKGDFRLLRWAEMSEQWSPDSDQRMPVWEALHQIIRALNQQGEGAAGALLARMPSRAEPVRSLAYRLYTLCERKGWAEEARAYNELVTAWGAIEQAAGEVGVIGTQSSLDI